MQNVLNQTAIQLSTCMCAFQSRGSQGKVVVPQLAAFACIRWVVVSYLQGKIPLNAFSRICPSPNPQQSLDLKNLIKQAHINTTYEHTKTSGAQPLSMCPAQVAGLHSESILGRRGTAARWPISHCLSWTNLQFSPQWSRRKVKLEWFTEQSTVYTLN